MKKYRITGILLLILSITMHCIRSREADHQISGPEQPLHDRVLVLDSHLDTPMFLLGGAWDPDSAGHGETIMKSRVDPPRIKQGGADALFFAVFVSQAARDRAGYLDARNMADRLQQAVFKAIAAHAQDLEFALSVNDVRRICGTGKCAILMGMENGYPVGRDLDMIETYFKRGIRYITLCHSRNNDICDSSTDPSGPEWDGVSPFGEQVIGEMNRLGIMIDVSHISDEAFDDVLRLSSAPVIASHSCCRALYDNPRNLTDAMIADLAAKGGVIQINLCSFYLKALAANAPADSAEQVMQKSQGSYYGLRTQDERLDYMRHWLEIDEKYPGDLADVTDLVNHIDHAVRVGGIDHVGIGSDLDGGAQIRGCMDIAGFPNITAELVKRGYSEEDIAKIWGENLLRVFQEVETLSARKPPAS
ncbi:dipeptidase [bacterium]|nr:dipeptidase [bacterium]